MSVSELRVLTAQAVGYAWAELLKNPKFMKWTFTCQGLTLPLDRSKDSEMDLQSLKKGLAFLKECSLKVLLVLFNLFIFLILREKHALICQLPKNVKNDLNAEIFQILVRFFLIISSMTLKRPKCGTT